jgi:WD40 repeat protein
LINSNKPADRVIFSPDSTSFVVLFNWAGEFRFTNQDQISGIDEPIDNIVFSPDGRMFIVDYRYRTGEIRDIKTSRVKLLSGLVDQVVFNPKGNNYIVTYTDDSIGEIRYLDTEKTVPLNDPVEHVVFSLTGSNFVVVYKTQRAELWSNDSAPKRIADLGLSVADVEFASADHWLIIRHHDRRAYLLDTSWLQEMGGTPTSLPWSTFVNLACSTLRSGGITANELAPYLDGRQPNGCP